MADKHNDRQQEVKIEDLLRLKRGERPDGAFWDAFDRELHQRMLQTLVKKDPWYVQLMRGVSSRIAQTAAIGAAAAFLAMMVVRPALVDLTQSESGEGNSYAHQKAAGISSNLSKPAEFASTITDLDKAATPDYRIEAISGTGTNSDSGYMQQFTHDRFEVTSYGSDAYAMDTASFPGTGLATALVY